MRKSSYASETSSKTSSLFEVLAVGVPRIMLMGGMAFLRMKARRRKGVRVFRKQLRGSGLTKPQIKELVTQYEQIGRIRSYLPGDLRGFGFMRA